jgi:outer membrane protein OmpA-like peptidoglycan-associated protein
MLSFRRLLVILATALGLVGCTTATTPESSTATTDTTSAPVIGVLVNTSPAGHVLGRAAQRSATATLIATAAGRSGAHVVVDRFGAGLGSAQVTYNARVTAETGENALIRKVQLEHAEAELAVAITDVPDISGSGPVDVIGGVRSMDGHLHAIPHGPADVVVLGGAMQTAAPINLADPAQLADPTATLRVVTSQGLLPTCKGWRVYMIGGSLTAQGGLDALRDVQLREFWRRFWARCGGHLVVWDTALTAFPASGGEIAPAGWTRTRNLIVPLPATLLFEPDRAVFRPGARSGLDRLVAMFIRAYPTATAEVAGYTAAVGGPETGAMALSRARAQAVAGYLTTHGVAAARLSVVGRGHQDPAATNTTEAGRTLNRRVVVTLHIR